MVPPSGPSDARIMIVGEAPGVQEVLQGKPFVGASGDLLNKMLHQAGILRSECFITNVARERPPNNDIGNWIPKAKKHVTPDMVLIRDRRVSPIVAAGMELLWKEISLVDPSVILALGNVPMWTITGKWGIKSWRGSLLSADNKLLSKSVAVVPAYHPAYILRDWSALNISVQDFKRAKEIVDAVAGRESLIQTSITDASYSFIIRPTFTEVADYLSNLKRELDEAPRKLSVDIETRGGHIACLGIAPSQTQAICIPFMCVGKPRGYWEVHEEVAIIQMLRQVLTHPNARVIGQNFIYDTQYIYKHWGFAPNFARDTMLGHHSCYSGLPKGLDYLSSMYCKKHVYWKDEGKNWEPKVGEEQLWTYNGKDCVITFEVDERIQEQVDRLGLRWQHDFQMAMFWPVLQAMVRGVRRDDVRTAEFGELLREELRNREEWFIKILGHPLNPKSPKQMRTLLYEDLNQRPIINRKTKEVTTDEEALEKIAAREPLLRPLVKRIAECRSLGVFLSTFVGARSGSDGRLRCSYNIAGTETYRLSSSKDAFDSGMNLQNIPEGEEKEDLELPNIKKLFLPDEGYSFFNCDLDRADLQVVAWEADDEDLKKALRAGMDMHLHSARAVYNLSIPDDELVETHPNYPEQKARHYAKRQNTRQVVHATNYVGSARTVAAQFGLTIQEVDRFQKIWFGIHPGIKSWHERTIKQLNAHKFVENKFGFRRYFFDRLESVIPEAVAWVPQSTVAHYINRIWLGIYRTLPDTQVLLQVHDSLAGQIPTPLLQDQLSKILLLAKSIVVPYSDPLVIPLSIKSSAVSWGDCE